MNTLHSIREVIVIDSGVADWKTLTAGLSPDIPVILLPEGGNGLDAMAEALSGYGTLDAVHLVSHGGTGRINLGDMRLTSANLADQAPALASIASHLSADADLLIYGCSVAAGDSGQTFVKSLSEALGGVDIAASTDRTGPLTLGGDWDLEFADGDIETVLPFTVQGMEGVDECLGCVYGNPTANATMNGCNASSHFVTASPPPPSPPPPPAVQDAYISISGASGTGGAYKIGDTVTATWNNTSGGDNNANVTGVTVNFSAFGGGTTVVATNSSGTWTASYVIAAGAIDGTSKNVSVTATYTGTSPTTATGADSTNATVDSVAPTVTDAKISISGASGTGGAYKVGDTVTATWNNTAGGDNNSDIISSATVDFSQFGGGAAVAATNSSGTWTASYTITAGAINATNRNVSVTATDNAGNTRTTADTSNATVDSQAPVVTSVSVPANSTYGASANLDFTVNFSESVTVDTSGGTPRIAITMGSSTVYATYLSGSGTSAHVYRYTTQNGDNDSDGIAVGVLGLNGGSVRDTNGNDATLTLNSVGSTAGVLVSTFSTPTVTGVSSSKADGSYKVGETIGVQVTFSESVTVDTSGGTPQLTLETGATDRVINYVSGSGTNTLTFTYTVQAGDTSADLDYANTSALILNSGTINATNGGAAATLTLPSPGAAGSLGANKAIVIDTTVPVAPSTPDLSGVSDSGSSTTDNLTKVTTPTFTGTAEAGVTVKLYDTDGTTELGSATATGGNWSITASTLAAGSHTVTAKATDAAGNVSTASSGLAVTIDTTAPTLDGVNAIPADNATNVALGSDIVIDFSENIAFGSSGTIITVRNVTDNTTVGTFSVPTAGQPATGAFGTTSISGDKLTINPGSDLLNDKTYAVQFGANAVLDTAGNALAAIANDTTYNFSTVPANARPVVTAGGTLAYTENASAAAVDSTLTLSDTESDAITGATVSISGGFTSGDTLGFVNQNGISGSYNSGTGVLTLSGTTSVANYQAALRSVAFASSSNDPTATSASRTVTWVASDAGGVGTGVTSTVNLTAVNDAPALNANGSSPTFTEDGSAVTLFGSANAIPQETGQTLTGLTLTVTNVSDTTERLGVDGSVVNLTNGASGTTTTNSMAYSVAVAGGTATVTLTKGAGISASAMETLITGLTYSDTSHVPSTASTRVVTLTSIQDSGGTANGGVDTGTPGGTPAMATVTVVAVNDPPVLDGSQTPVLTAIARNIGDAANTGTSVAALVVNGSITDADIAAPANVPEAIIVETVDNANGTWQFKVGAGNWTDFHTIGTPLNTATGTGIVLQSTDLIRFVPTTNYTGTATITFHAWDTTDGKASGSYTTFTGNTAAGYSLVGDTASITVLPAPTLTSATYDASIGALVLTGANFPPLAGATNDIVASKFTFTAEGGATYTLTDTSNVEITSGTAATITLSATDKAAINQIINKNGTTSTGGTPYNIAAAEDWAAGANAADTIADLTGNAITASNVASPTITSATYDTGSGVLVVTGTGFLKLNGATNDIDISKLKFTGQGGAGAAYTLTSASDVEITSGTSFTVTLSGADKTAVDALLNKSGTSANDNTTYVIGGLEDWAAGADAAVTVADETGNGITVTVPAPPAPEPDPAPAPAPAPSPAPVPADNDGVTAEKEDTTPGLPQTGGQAPVAGDGNGDGVQDSQQAGVTSTTFLQTTTSESKPAGAPSTFITLVADSLGGKADPDAGTAAITGIVQKDAPAVLPEGMSAPLGLIGFTASIAQAGSQETFSLYVDAQLGVNGYWKKDASGTWINLASEAYGGKMVSEGGKLRLDFQIVDGGQFDSDGVANGTISDPGIIGTMAQSITEHHPKVPTLDHFWF